RAAHLHAHLPFRALEYGAWQVADPARALAHRARDPPLVRYLVAYHQLVGRSLLWAPFLHRPDTSICALPDSLCRALEQLRALAPRGIHRTGLGQWGDAPAWGLVQGGVLLEYRSGVPRSAPRAQLGLVGSAVPPLAG